MLTCALVCWRVDDLRAFPSACDSSSRATQRSWVWCFPSRATLFVRDMCCCPYFEAEWSFYFIGLGQKLFFNFTLQSFKPMNSHLGFKYALNILGPFFRAIPLRKLFKSMTTFLFQLRKQKEFETDCLFGTGLCLDFRDIS